MNKKIGESWRKLSNEHKSYYKMASKDPTLSEQLIQNSNEQTPKQDDVLDLISNI